MQEIEWLYEKYKSELFGYFMWLIHDTAQAEDLLQETFLKALSSLDRFEGKSSVRTWLFSIARHIWLDSLRKKKNHRVSSLEDASLLWEDRLQDDLINRHTIDQIQTALLQKDENTRRIVAMRSHGYSYAEIAKECKISENSARVILFRTRTWLKKYLEEEGF